tara:strand:+ start:33 stop:656 length:624 start_codon:yes stop_codon:yes gene_type:complete
MALKPYQERTAMFEGFKPNAYLDSMGYPTIGFGEKLENIKYTKEQGVPAHLQNLIRTREEAGTNLQSHYDQIMPDVINRFGENWKDIPTDIQGVVLDMGYNVGPDALFNKFPGFIDDIRSGNYEGAAANLKYKDPALGDNPNNYSLWWNQIGGANTESNINTGEWGPDSRAVNRGTANYDVLMNYKSPDTELVDNVTTEQGSQAFNY